MLVSQQSPTYAYWQPLIQPWVHYVPCARWFDDLPDVVRRLQLDDSLARRIADGGQQFEQRFLSLDAAKDYTAALLGRYAHLMAEEVTDDDIAAVNCKAIKNGPMGCDTGWREWDGVNLKYPANYFKQKAMAESNKAKVAGGG